MSHVQVLFAEAESAIVGNDRFITADELRERGLEVIYTSLNELRQKLAETSIMETIDLVCLMSYTKSQLAEVLKVVTELKNQGINNIPVIGAGNIPKEDISLLVDEGINKVFTREFSVDMVTGFIKQVAREKKILLPPKKVSHIGIAVESIEACLPFYCESLGMNLEKKEVVKSEQVKVAFLSIGETRIELLEPLRKESVIGRFISKYGTGIHHVALEVDNIDLRLKQLKKQGIQILSENSKKGSMGSEIAFIHPADAGGVLFELTQPEEGRDSNGHV